VYQPHTHTAYLLIICGGRPYTKPYPRRRRWGVAHRAPGHSAADPFPAPMGAPARPTRTTHIHPSLPNHTQPRSHAYRSCVFMHCAPWCIVIYSHCRTQDGRTQDPDTTRGLPKTGTRTETQARWTRRPSWWNHRTRWAERKNRNTIPPSPWRGVLRAPTTPHKDHYHV
jgi:hypothetical protein